MEWFNWHNGDSMTRSELLPEIFKLDPGDQFMIAEAIRNRLVNEAEFKRELDRRVRDADARPEDQSPLDEVVRRLRNRP